MTAALKLGITLLLSGYMFFSPIGCAESRTAATQPVHPCCPQPAKQIPSDCARPGCVYMEAKPMVVEAPASIDDGIVGTAETASTVQQSYGLSWGGATEPPSLAQDHRYLTLHQLLL